MVLSLGIPTRMSANYHQSSFSMLHQVQRYTYKVNSNFYPFSQHRSKNRKACRLSLFKLLEMSDVFGEGVLLYRASWILTYPTQGYASLVISHLRSNNQMRVCLQI